MVTSVAFFFSFLFGERYIFFFVVLFPTLVHLSAMIWKLHPVIYWLHGSCCSAKDIALDNYFFLHGQLMGFILHKWPWKPNLPGTLDFHAMMQRLEWQKFLPILIYIILSVQILVDLGSVVVVCWNLAWVALILGLAHEFSLMSSTVLPNACYSILSFWLWSVGKCGIAYYFLDILFTWISYYFDVPQT